MPASCGTCRCIQIYAALHVPTTSTQAIRLVDQFARLAAACCSIRLLLVLVGVLLKDRLKPQTGASGLIRCGGFFLGHVFVSLSELVCALLGVGRLLDEARFQLADAIAAKVHGVKVTLGTNELVLMC